MDNVFSIDIEADNLYPYQKTIWVIVVNNITTGDKIVLYPFKSSAQIVKNEIIDFIFKDTSSLPVIVAHNGLGYDFWVLWKTLDISFSLHPDLLDNRKVKFFDTLYASQFLLPDRVGGHSLKNLGESIGVYKIDYRSRLIELGFLLPTDKEKSEFSFYNSEMDDYCIQDTVVCGKLYNKFIEDIHKRGNYSAFINGQLNFYLMQAQSFTGFKFDKELGEQLLPQINQMMLEIKEEVDPLLPLRPLKKAEKAPYTVPQNIYKANGDYTVHMTNFLVRHNAVVTDGILEAYGVKYHLVPKLVLDVKFKMNIEDQIELKDWFLEIGWEPTLWNIKKDSKGKPVRDENMQVIRTSPKIQESGKICPNLLELDGELPKKIVKFLSLRNRKGVLEGWLKNPRLDFDGRLPAGASGIASTHRQKHVTVVNCPKAEEGVLLGKEFRSLFTVDEDNVLIGCDQAALEARVQGHWTYKIDGGETARLLLEKDPHSKNAKAFYPEETASFDIDSPDFDKDHPKFKPYRSKSKNGGYAIMYGCAPAKLAATLGKPVELGVKLLEAYWEANYGLKTLKDKVEKFWIEKGGKKWIPGIDGRRLYSRSKHSLINLLFQSTGAIVVDTALCLFHKIMGPLLIDDLGRPYYSYKGYQVKRVQYFHDEFGVETHKDIGEEVSSIIEHCMSEAGVVLNLSIELKGEGKIGKNWKETH